jgi:arylsulfate sulfotransferase
VIRVLLCMATAVAVLTLQACGGSGGPSTPSSLSQDFLEHTDAALSNLEIASSDPGVSPFIQWLSIRGAVLTALSTVAYTVQPKAGSVSKAVHVTYSNAALTARGYVTPGGTVIRLPVVGLYAGYTNVVALEFGFQDGSTLTLATNITTADYADPTGVYMHPTIVKQRAAGSALGFDFFYMKSYIGSPIIVDTDGEVRWAAPGIANAWSSALQDDEFVIGDASSAVVHRLRLDGTMEQNPVTPLASASVINFHHNIDYGSVGLLAEVNTQEGSVQNVESTMLEITEQGSVLNQWDLGPLISAYMLSMGDDPTAFVRPGFDWFHNNSAAYDATDNTVIVSSRENFVIKLDYQTGRIIWILGDPTKYWYTFPSLRAKALALAPGGLYPIGQHALSITSDGHLLLFNDGLGSVSQPAGAPAGESRTFSAVSAYSIDTETMTAQNIWNFENGQTIYSSVCSSVYRAPASSLLIDYATADNDTDARLVGLDAHHNVAFEFRYVTQQCNTSWNAVPIPLDAFTIN